MEKMKCIMAKAKNTVFRDRRLRIFCSAFLLYLFLGMCLSYYTAFDTNMFFGADNARVFQDLTNITGEHYRVSVHPLLIFYLEMHTDIRVTYVRSFQLPNYFPDIFSTLVYYG